jgi:prophage tail gpP-like protein
MSDLVGKDRDEMTLVIENREIVVESSRLLKTMDTCAFAYTATMPWIPGLDPDIDDKTRPYGYQEAEIYIAGKSVMKGILYNVTHAKEETRIYKNLEIYSKTADVIDSSVRFPFEENNVDFYERCLSMMNSTVSQRQFDIDVVIDDGVDVGGKFARVSAEQTDNLFEHLRDLASQRGLLLSCTPGGDLLITRAKTGSAPVGTITDITGIVEKYEAEFNGRERFKFYEAISSSSRSDRTKRKSQASDLVVTRPRFLTFNATQSLPGEGLNAALWRRNKSAADALSIPLPTNTWYAPNGTLWDKNTTLNLQDEIISENGFTFLINQVEFVYEENGTTANLQLIPPSLYTTGEIKEPWQN